MYEKDNMLGAIMDSNSKVEFLLSKALNAINQLCWLVQEDEKYHMAGLDPSLARSVHTWQEDTELVLRQCGSSKAEGAHQILSCPVEDIIHKFIHIPQLPGIEPELESTLFRMCISLCFHRLRVLETAPGCSRMPRHTHPFSPACK